MNPGSGILPLYSASEDGRAYTSFSEFVPAWLCHQAFIPTTTQFDFYQGKLYRISATFDASRFNAMQEAFTGKVRQAILSNCLLITRTPRVLRLPEASSLGTTTRSTITLSASTAAVTLYRTQGWEIQHSARHRGAGLRRTNLSSLPKTFRSRLLRAPKFPAWIPADL